MTVMLEEFFTMKYVMDLVRTSAPSPNISKKNNKLSGDSISTSSFRKSNLENHECINNFKVLREKKYKDKKGHKI